MSDFKIEKNVPLPVDGRTRNRRYPWREMEIGDSVFIPNEQGQTSQQTMSRLGASLNVANPFKFTRRSEPNGVRVWRIK